MLPRRALEALSQGGRGNVEDLAQLLMQCNLSIAQGSSQVRCTVCTLTTHLHVPFAPWTLHLPLDSSFLSRENELSGSWNNSVATFCHGA